MKYILAILFCALCYTAGAQSFYKPWTMDTANCKLRIYNTNSVKFAELDAKDLTFHVDQGADYVIRSGSIQVSIIDTLNSPAFHLLPAYLLGVQQSCKVSGTSVSVSASISTTNDSAFIWNVTDSLILNPVTYRSVSFSVTEGDGIIRSGSRNTTVPEDYNGTFTSDALLVERLVFVGKFIVNAIK